ncbi:MAG: type transport system ATP-binding protein [Acidobacteriota bacterium]|jgi:ABC-2 type transport system ATP-binding protein|nr:type transport system ATP-binding protein [Acidobacteriota bacterium]
MGDAVLRTERLTKKYRGRVAVEGLSLEVARGDIYGFLGQNGAGKSTTIRMALGLVRPTSGRVWLLGHDAVKDSRRSRQRVGGIVEAPAFYENLSGLQNLRIFAAMSGGADRRRVESMLDLVGLAGRGRDPVRTYSHGMRQRLGIAQALLPDPEFVILDEPTDGLDPQGIREVRGLIRRMRDQLGLTVMLSSHLLNEVEQLCNRVAIIDRGRLLYQGGVGELTAAGKLFRLRVDRAEDAYQLLSRDPEVSVNRDGTQVLYVKTADEHIPVVNALLVERGFRVMELSPQRETLEEVYFRLIQEARR